MTTKTTDTLTQRLAAALDAHAKAKHDGRPEDRPFHDYDMGRMRHAGMRKGAERNPALNMAAKAPDSPLAFDLESGRVAANDEAKADKSARRMATMRARAARKVALDKIADSPAKPSTERMQAAWLIVVHLSVIIDKIAQGKQRWASRFLGTTMDDVPSMAREKMALILAKSDKDLDVLTEAARQLGEQTSRTNQIPGDQLTDDERKERKKIGKARKWLMGVVNNRVMGALVDAYMSERNLRWDNIDRIATVMANLNGPDHDPMMAAFKADRAPAFMAARFQRPEGIDPDMIAVAISAAITDRGLDRLTELILHEDSTNGTDGSLKWSELAQDVFLAAPEDGEWKWQQVMAATTGRTAKGMPWTPDRARRARADAARLYVQGEFEWMPRFVVTLIEAFDPQFIGWSSTGHRAIMASEFELFHLPERPGTAEKRTRLVLEPALRFDSTAEAARLLGEHLACLVTGNDLVTSVVNE